MLSFRNTIKQSDVPRIREMLTSTHFFEESPDEIDVAIELADIALADYEKSEYKFLFIQNDDQVLGYICYGKIACTVSSFEIYWICVDKQQQNNGIGKKLIREVVRIIKDLGGKKLMLETAGRAEYLPTQKFYASCGFQIEAKLKNYYTIGDDCLIFTMDL